MGSPSGKRTRPPIFLGALIAMVVQTAGNVAGTDVCALPFLQFEGWSGFSVTAHEGTTSVSFAPWRPNSPVLGDPSPHFTFEGILEELARKARILPVFVALPPACSAVDKPTSWTGESALEVLEQVLEDCGLEMVVHGNFGIVTRSEMTHATAVILSIGPVAGGPLPPKAEEGLYRDLYVHKFSTVYTYSSHSLYSVQIGYLRVPEDPNELIVFAGTGESHLGGSYRVFRARLEGGEDPSAQCQWVEWDGGSPVESFTEDVDRDGWQDILIDRTSQSASIHDDLVPSSIVSGRTGEVLFSFIMPWMAIQKTGDGLFRISAETKEAYMAGEACLPIFELSPTTGTYRRVAVTRDAEPGSLACTHPAARLSTTWDGTAAVTAYDLMRYAPNQHTTYRTTGYESRVIRAASSFSFANPVRIRNGEVLVEGNSGCRIMLRHIPKGYIEAGSSLR